MSEERTTKPRIIRREDLARYAAELAAYQDYQALELVWRDEGKPIPFESFSALLRNFERVKHTENLKVALSRAPEINP